MKNKRFFLCKHCGNLVELDLDKGGTLVCCGDKMTELIPNTTDGAKEKHVPVIALTDDGLSVTVSSQEHPMTEEHHIAFVYVQTENGGEKRFLKIGSKPHADFCMCKEKPVAVYAYCNLHGLWKTENI